MDKKLLEILVCPQSRESLVYDETKQELISVGAKLAYPVKEGIPVMLVDEARVIEEVELEKYRP